MPEEHYERVGAGGMSGFQGGMDDEDASESPEAGNPRQLVNGNIQNQLGQYMAQ